MAGDGEVDWKTRALPDATTRRRLLLAANDRMSAVFEAIDAAPALRHGMLEPALAAIEATDFGEPVEAEAAIAELVAALAVRPGWQLHRMAFGMFTPQPIFPGVVGELIAASMNPQLSTAESAPVAYAIERRLIDLLGGALGFPQGERAGHFTAGGAEANTTALIVALTRAFPDASRTGLAGLSQTPVLYVSAAGHPTWTKAARITGLGTDNLRKIATDARGRMLAPALQAAIDADRAAGRRPLMVAATAGTTVAGEIDPLTEILAIAQRVGLYLHVDAAWGGSATLSPRARSWFAGIEGADSVTLDSHKWLGMPLAAGVFLSRDAAALRAAFAADSYFTDGESDDLSVSSLQWSRRANGLKLYLSLKMMGLTGFVEMIDHAIELGETLKAALTERGWRIENDTPLPVVCFNDPGGAAPQAIAQRLNLRGQAFVTAMTLAGRPVLRAGIVNAKTEAADIWRLMDHLDAARRAVKPEPART